MHKFEKLKLSLRYWLLARAETQPEYYKVLDALEYAAQFHQGRRKDGQTPEFQHQLEIVQYVRTLSNGLMHPVETLAAGLLHDVAEDYDVGFEELEDRFGKSIAHPVMLLTKKHRGHQVPADLYFARIAKDPVASVVKGGDRINNLQSMLGVFSLDKQNRYCQETLDYFLPMLKEARRTFARQEPVYENIKLMLKSQLVLLQAVRDAHGHPGTPSAIVLPTAQ